MGGTDGRWARSIVCIGFVLIVLVAALAGFTRTALFLAASGSIALMLAFRRLPIVAVTAPPSSLAWPGGVAAHDKLRDWWRDHNGPTPTPIQEEEIAAFEMHHGLSLPDDFRAYLRHGSPSAEVMDDECTTWWPFGRLRTLAEECPDDPPSSILRGHDGRYVVFADHMLWCWAWAICCTDDDDRGKVMLVGSGDRLVADSFTDFVRRHLTDWRSLC